MHRRLLACSLVGFAALATVGAQDAAGAKPSSSPPARQGTESAPKTDKQIALEEAAREQAAKGSKPPPVGARPVQPRWAGSDPSTKRDRDNIAKSADSRQFVRYDVTSRPKVVAPGATATFEVLMVLQGNAAMLADPAPKLAVESKGAVQALDAPQMRPPSGPAKLAPALKGQPGYDNFAVIDVPFAVAADAPAGPQQLQLTVHYQLLDGKVSREIGQFTDKVDLVVTVGQPAAEQAQAAQPTAAASPTGSAGGPAAGAGPRATTGDGTSGAQAAPIGLAATAAKGLGAEDSPPSPPSPPSGGSYLLVGSAAAAVVLLLVGLVARTAAGRR